MASSGFPASLVSGLKGGEEFSFDFRKCFFFFSPSLPFLCARLRPPLFFSVLLGVFLPVCLVWGFFAVCFWFGGGGGVFWGCLWLVCLVFFYFKLAISDIWKSLGLAALRLPQAAKARRGAVQPSCSSSG